jgi:segregation and condensation protein A
MENILNRLKFKRKFSFNEIIDSYVEKARIIVAFVALLELARLKKIRISQEEVFGELIIEDASQGWIANAI